jgi:hypothetical protein
MTTVNRRLRRTIAAGAVALAVIAASGCGDNLGPDTSCSKFITLSPSDQDTAIKALLDSKGQSTSFGSVLIARGSAQAFCRTVGVDKKIKGIYGDG